MFSYFLIFVMTFMGALASVFLKKAASSTEIVSILTKTTFEVQDLSATGAATTIGLSVTLTVIIIAATARVLDRSDTRC